MSEEPNAHEPGHHDHHAVDRYKHEPEDHAIRERAYAIWVAEGMPEGREVDHWMRARQELEHEAEHR